MRAIIKEDGLFIEAHSSSPYDQDIKDFGPIPWEMIKRIDTESEEINVLVVFKNLEEVIRYAYFWANYPITLKLFSSLPLIRKLHERSIERTIKAIRGEGYRKYKPQYLTFAKLEDGYALCLTKEVIIDQNTIIRMKTIFESKKGIQK